MFILFSVDEYRLLVASSVINFVNECVKNENYCSESGIT